MKLTSFAIALAVGVVLTLTGANVARADAIDGAWCVKDGRLMSITRTHILMPNGKRIPGLYDRHAYSYTVPNGDEGAGSKVYMILVDPGTIHLWKTEAAARKNEPPAEVWHRCSAHVS